MVECNPYTQQMAVFLEFFLLILDLSGSLCRSKDEKSLRIRQHLAEKELSCKSIHSHSLA